MPLAPLGRPGPLPRTAWKQRARVLADASGVSLDGLGELVESELTRLDGLLFTATPAEELDEISRWARLADGAWCGQVRAIVATRNRMSELDREFLACEVALALNLSDGAAQDLIARALAAAELPGLVEAVEAGMLTVRHVYAVLGALDGCALNTPARHAIVLIALARYHGQTPAELAKMIARLLLTADPAAAAAREADRSFHRQVRIRAVEDGQGLLTARGPLAMLEAVRAALHAHTPDPVDAEDRRTADARTFDYLVQRLTGSPTGGLLDPHPEMTTPAQDAAPAGGSAPGGWVASIVIPYDVAAGGERELAEIPGLGPVLPATARDILASASGLHRIAVDTTGQVLEVSDLLPGPAARATDTDLHSWLTRLAQAPRRIGIPVGSAGYQPSPRLRRYVEARDRQCVFPGCPQPAERADLDHRIPYPRGGTDPENLHALCRRHHRAKQRIFTVDRLPDGTTQWTTRGGWVFDRPPQGY